MSIWMCNRMWIDLWQSLISTLLRVPAAPSKRADGDFSSLGVTIGLFSSLLLAWGQQRTFPEEGTLGQQPWGWLSGGNGPRGSFNQEKACHAGRLLRVWESKVDGFHFAKWNLLIFFLCRLWRDSFRWWRYIGQPWLSWQLRKQHSLWMDHRCSFWKACLGWLSLSQYRLSSWLWPELRHTL